MPIRSARAALSRIFFQRCFYLFVVLVVLLTLAPLIPESSEGRFVANVINAFVVVATVAAVGRTVFSFIVALLLAAPTLFFQWYGLSLDDTRWVAYSWTFGALLYLATVIYLLDYVFRPDVMTADKLFGAAAGYLMLGVFWGYLYRLIGYFNPAAFSVSGQPAPARDARSVVFQHDRPDQHGLWRHCSAHTGSAGDLHGRADCRRALPGDPDCPAGRRLFGIPAGAMTSRYASPCASLSRSPRHGFGR